MIASTYSGVRVLDLSTNIAGPLAAMILADFGADVVKVERPPYGDDTRRLPPQVDGQSTIFMTFNRNKRSVLLDYKTAAGSKVLERLIRRSDIVIESFPPAVGRETGVTWDSIRRLNERAILCSISAFGDGSIGAGLPGYDALVQAMSGMMSFTGHPGEKPSRLAPSVLDITTGLWAAVGMMASLARRSNGGTGEHLRPSLIDSAFHLMGHQVAAYFATGENPVRLGSGTPSAVPYRVYDAADGNFMLATASDPQFERLCRSIGRAELVADARFSSMSARLANRGELDTILQIVFAGNSVASWLDCLSRAGLSVGRVNTLAEATSLPVVQERQLFVRHGEGKSANQLPLVRLPLDLEGAAFRMSPPRLGQHTVEVLGELDLAPAESDVGS